MTAAKRVGGVEVTQKLRKNTISQARINTQRQEGFESRRSRRQTEDGLEVYQIEKDDRGEGRQTIRIDAQSNEVKGGPTVKN